MTLRTYASAKSGSIPLDVPAMMLMVPVGAMVVVVALRRGASPRAANSDRWKLGNSPRAFASSLEASLDASCMADMILSAIRTASSLSYGMPSLTSMSANAITPRPILRLAFVFPLMASRG